MKRFFRLSAMIVAATAVWYSATAGSMSGDSSSSACGPSPHDLGHYFFVGGAMVDNRAITDRVESLGYPGFSRYSGTFGFGGLRRYGRYVSGGFIEGLAWKPNRGEYFSSFSAGRLVSQHGISLLSSANMALYPLVGIGLGVSSLKVKRTETDFDAALNNPPVTQMHSETVTQMTMLIDLGIGFQFARPAHEGCSALKTIGLRAGYMLDPLDNSTWRRGDAVLDNGPHSDLSGPYLRLTLGKIRGGSCDKRFSRHGGESCSMAMCPHMKGAGRNCTCPAMNSANKADCCPHMRGMEKSGSCPGMMKEADKAGGCPRMKDAANPPPPPPEGAGDVKETETK